MLHIIIFLLSFQFWDDYLCYLLPPLVLISFMITHPMSLSKLTSFPHINKSLLIRLMNLLQIFYLSPNTNDLCINNSVFIHYYILSQIVISNKKHVHLHTAFHKHTPNFKLHQYHYYTLLHTCTWFLWGLLIYNITWKFHSITTELVIMP